VEEEDEDIEESYLVLADKDAVIDKQRYTSAKDDLCYLKEFSLCLM